MNRKKRYKYILFDLDHTLWDFKKNSSETLHQLFYEYELDLKLKISFNSFVEKYIYFNHILWKKYEQGLMKKEHLRWQRFYNTLIFFNYKDENLSKLIAEKYITISPYKSHLIPYAKEVLEELHSKYKMIIITNGFEEIQKIKIRQSGLNKYFSSIICSESTNHKKPFAPIFHKALNSINATRTDSLMIGDNYISDIMGAKNFGIDQVYYNPENKIHKYQATYTISSLSQLISILK